MLLSRETLEGIRSGALTAAFRRWRRPTVRSGGSLMTAEGRLAIRRVEPTELSELTADDARRAGFPSVSELAAALGNQPGTLYRIEFGDLSPDPRTALRETMPDDAESARLIARLAAMDRRADRPWTRDALALIRSNAGVRAADLAVRLGMERLQFKANVRKLKALGLTASLETGYELSARGTALLDRLESRRES